MPMAARHCKFAYLAEPLPSPLNALRAALYEVLVPVANTQKEMFRAEIAPKQLKLEEFPPRWGWTGAGRYCPTGCMQPHRDLQGSVMFPFQAMLPLSDPGTDYEGGRFFVQPGKRDVGRQYCQELLTGDLIIFRSGLYHGVEPLTRGRRFAIAMQFALSHLNENPSLPRRTWEEKMELEKQQSAQTELEQPPLG
ncbi:unnamed protein product [Effrenium voratum]|nr:unnamed protein product [Effrenium voratum]